LKLTAFTFGKIENAYKGKQKKPSRLDDLLVRGKVQAAQRI
jgi:hypothetical protein